MNGENMSKVSGPGSGKKIPQLTIQDQTKFYSLVSKKDTCWQWLGNKNATGYGTFFVNGSHFKAHRISFSLNNNVDMNGLDVLHKCNNSGCVNPDHLKLGNHKENMRDRIESGNNPQLKKTHCKSGHLFDQKNTRFNIKSNKRGCKLCVKMAKEKYLLKLLIRKLPRHAFEEAKQIIMSFGSGH